MLLSVDLIFGKYSIAVFGREFNILFVRNFLFVGLPYFILGNALQCLHIKERAEKSILRYLLIFSIPVMIALCMIERYIILSLGVNATRDHYISTTLLACAVFSAFLSAVPNESKRLRWISYIGRNASLDIYIIHPIVISVLHILSKAMHIEKVYSYIAPFLVYFVSVVISVIYRRMLCCLRNRFNKRLKANEQ